MYLRKNAYPNPVIGQDGIQGHFNKVGDIEITEIVEIMNGYVDGGK